MPFDYVDLLFIIALFYAEIIWGDRLSVNLKGSDVILKEDGTAVPNQTNRLFLLFMIQSELFYCPVETRWQLTLEKAKSSCRILSTITKEIPYWIHHFRCVHHYGLLVFNFNNISTFFCKYHRDCSSQPPNIWWHNSFPAKITVWFTDNCE